MSLLKSAAHPGRILNEEYLLPLELSAGALAAHIKVPRTRIERLVKGEVAMSADTAARLAAAFGSTAQFWLNLQVNYDVATMARVTGVKRIRTSIHANSSRRPMRRKLSAA